MKAYEDFLARKRIVDPSTGITRRIELPDFLKPHQRDITQWAKLDEDSVRFIRSACASGQKQKDLAVQFGVHPSVISAAVTRRKWAHVE